MTDATDPTETTDVVDATEATEATEATDIVDTKDTPDSTDTTEANDAKDQEKGDYDVNVWGDTGDETGNSVLQLLHESGVGIDDAKSLMYDAIVAGKPQDIDREALIEKVGKTRATLIMAGVESFVDKRAAAEQAAKKAVYEAAGGEAAWNTVLPWVKKLPEDQRQELSDMIDAGGLKAKLAVKEIVEQYNADPKNARLNVQELQGENRQGKAVQGISQRDYGDALIKLNRLGNATPEALAALRAQRRAGKAQGL